MVPHRIFRNFNEVGLVSDHEIFQPSLSNLIFIREKEIANLKQVVDFTIENYMPAIRQENYLAFFAKVLEQSASLVSQWMAHGFTHG
jgi:hypothetical protein